MPGMWELVIIVLILVVLFGGTKAMGTIKNLGREVYDIKKKLDDINDIKRENSKAGRWIYTGYGAERNSRARCPSRAPRTRRFPS